eukprot:GFYU01015271.1.p1 GENE.GFYU01015271.1~~GFYU01015271.1.p1  ORF type:complete len:321 (-),score=75.76 GFYU01015271.1:328-1221(-)
MFRANASKLLRAAVAQARPITARTSTLPVTAVRAYATAARQSLSWTRSSAGVAASVAATGFVALAGVAYAEVDDGTLHHMHHKADELYEQQKYQEVVDLLKDMKDCNSLWRLAQALMCLGKLELSAQKRELLFHRAVAAAQAAVKANPDSFEAHLMAGKIIYQAPPEALIGLDHHVERHLRRAIELRPTDTSAYHTLGVIAVQKAKGSWFSHQWYKYIGSASSQKDWQEALDLLLKAEKLAPMSDITNTYLIGKCYYKLGDHAAAKQWFAKVLSSPAKDDVTVAVKERAEETLTKCK